MNQYRGCPPPQRLAESLISLSTPLEDQLLARRHPLIRAARAELRLLIAFGMRMEEMTDVLGDRLRPPEVASVRRRMIAFVFQDPEVQASLSRYVSGAEHAPVRPFGLADAA